MAIPNIREIIDTDHEYIDLTANVRVDQPDGTAWECSHALRFNYGVEWGAVGDGEIPGGTVVFALWADQCDERPKLSATLTNLDTDEKYKVADVKDVAANSRYDVLCVPVVIAWSGG